MKIAVFGSAFNPPSYSHLKIIEKLSLIFDKVLVVPCYSHNFGKGMIGFDHRFKMANLLVENLSGNIEVTDIEKHLFENETSKTYLLLKRLKADNKENDYVFACGYDNANIENWSKFYKYDLIDKEFGKYVIEDGIFDVRSTEIRNNLKSNLSIKGMTTPEIIKYIKDNSILF